MAKNTPPEPQQKDIEAEAAAKAAAEAEAAAKAAAEAEAAAKAAAEAEAAAKATQTVKARVLQICEHGKPNDVVLLTAEAAAAAQQASLVDTDPAAVAYAESLQAQA